MSIIFVIGTMAPCTTMPFFISVCSSRMCLVSLIVRSPSQFCRQGILLYFTSKEFLYALEEIYLIVRDKSNGNTISFCPGCSSNAMNIILDISWHIIVDDHLDIININATCHNICCHKDIYAARLESEHHIVPFSLR